MDPADLERLIDRELQRLPSPRAPRTLLPRVMQAVRLAERPAVSAPNWFTWPRVWQVASIAAVVVLVAGAVELWPMAQAALIRLAWPSPAPAASRAGGMVDGMRVMWRVLHPLLIPIFVFFGMLAAACGAGGVALKRVAL